MSECVHVCRVLLAAALIPVVTLCAQDTQIDYRRDVRPLLHAKCVTCHGPLRSRSGLRLDTARLLLQGGESGVAVVPGNAAKSLLIERISTGDPDLRMPPEGDRLNAEEIAQLTRWIAAGAKSPVDEMPLQNPGTHWAFSVPVRPDIPKGSDSSNAIDAFLNRQRRKRGLTAAPQAGPRVLLRRVYLDLIGLPPDPEQIAAFEKPPGELQWNRVIDTLLDSPHYGERWGRHWMDIWRYSDWYGYRAELRNSARHIWRWRDWIIDATCADKPYNRMVLEMLAGDELAPDSPETLRATGFLARHYFKFNRDTWLNATVEHTAKAFLGLTLNCARCHDHMYDPLTMRDYYSFRAIFEPYQVRIDRVPGQSDTTRDGLSLAYDADPAKLTYLYLRGNDKRPDKTSPVQAALPEFFATELQPVPIDLPPEAWYPGLRSHIRQEALATALANVKARTDLVSSAVGTLTEARQQLARARSQRRPPPLPEPRHNTASAGQPQGGTRARFFTDAFLEKTDAWEFGSGTWEFQNNGLQQSSTGASRRTITLKQLPPRNFSATFEFRILGGERWKSVGLDFDGQAGDTSQTVYVSAYAGGPKVQYSHRTAGNTVYPRSAARPFPIQINRKHTLQVTVLNSLMNVHVDGKLSLALRLPVSRRSGRISLWTFDAAAEFLAVKIETLSGPVQLANATQNSDASGVNSVVDPAAVMESARLSHEAAQLELRAARLNVDFHHARTAADAAKFGRSPGADAIALSRDASQLSQDHALAVATALVKRRQAEHAASRLKPKTDRDKAVQAALTAVTRARKQLAALKTAPDSQTVTYPPLTRTYPPTSTGRRLALARWIADRKNPLTARVAVNHVWMRHFGEPLVASVFDFGLNGSRPSHPELLDWLAVDFMEHDWSLKHLHRRILTSAAWRMQSSSQHSDQSVQAALTVSAQTDPDNRWLWRANPRRMESEIVRDCILAVSGQLDTTRGGPELDQQTGLTTSRRSIYYRHAPEKQMTFLTLFDTASTDECYRRSETVAPQQALALVNSQLAIEQSRHLTALLHQGHSLPLTPAGHGPFIKLVFFQTLGRAPTPQEFSECRKFLEQQAERFRTGTRLTAFRQGVTLRVAPSTEPAIRSRENLAHVLLNHNDFVTVR